MQIARRKPIKMKASAKTFTARQGWREIAGEKYYFRSSWEANYARYLQFLKEKGQIKEWLHEPQTFWFENIKRGTRSYLPDFKVIRNNDSHYWVEVKGYMDNKSNTKLKRFKKYYPNEEMHLITSDWFVGKAEKTYVD